MPIFIYEGGRQTDTEIIIPKNLLTEQLGQSEIRGLGQEERIKKILWTGFNSQATVHRLNVFFLGKLCL